MPPARRLLAAACLSLAAAGAAHAATITAVEIDGLDEAMTTNVRVSLSLVDAIGREVSERRLAYLVHEAEPETREALEPFGYYSPTIQVRSSLSGETDAGGGEVVVTVAVEPGAPVRVRGFNVGIEGDGGDDRYLKREIDAFLPRPGAVFEHAVYEASKAQITRRLAERGYFDADFTRRLVEVTRAEFAADIALRWSSGERFDMGPITFVQTPETIIRDSLLHKLVYWEQGDYYHQGRLDRLRRSLVALDYFNGIIIETKPEAAIEREVPVTVTLTPARPSVYTAGFSYGTDSGLGGRLGLEKRYLNDRGHKLLAQVDWAQQRKTATVQYRVPAFAWLDGWYTASLQGADEQTDFVDTRRLELVGSRSGEVTQLWTATASLHALRERWRLFDDPDNPALNPYRYATLLFPSLRAEYIDTDDRLYPRAGFGGNLLLRGGLQGLGSDASFGQAYLQANWFRGLGAQSRLLVRGEAGYTFTSDLVEIPLSLRFFAGGNRSIRGYEWREVGPRFGDFALGAKSVLTGSVEYERYVRGPWGFAVFVDSGSAFDNTPDWHTGVGIGLRWRSPVGPVRVDIARGLNDPQSPLTLYLNIGPDL